MSFVPVDDGRWVSEQYERLAAVITDYDPQFELRWIPPEHRSEPGDILRCYVVWDVISNTPVFYASESDNPETILARLFAADNKHGNVLERLDIHNAAVRALELKEQMDRAEDKKDKVAFLIGTEKNFINMGNGRVVDDQLREVRRGRER